MQKVISIQGRQGALAPNPYEQRAQARAALKQAEADLARAKAHYASTGSPEAETALQEAEALAARAWRRSDEAEGLVVDLERQLSTVDSCVRREAEVLAANWMNHPPAAQRGGSV